MSDNIWHISVKSEPSIGQRNKLNGSDLYDIRCNVDTIRSLCHNWHKLLTLCEGRMKQLFFVGTSREDLREFPADVRESMGYALFEAQNGVKHRNTKPLKGFGGASVLEVIDDFDGDTYRTVYTVKFDDFVYVLHAFQKKSKKGKQTPKHNMDLVKSRLKEAQHHYALWLRGGGRD